MVLVPCRGTSTKREGGRLSCERFSGSRSGFRLWVTMVPSRAAGTTDHGTIEYHRRLPVVERRLERSHPWFENRGRSWVTMVPRSSTSTIAGAGVLSSRCDDVVGGLESRRRARARGQIQTGSFHSRSQRAVSVRTRWSLMWSVEPSTRSRMSSITSSAVTPSPAAVAALVTG